MKIHEALEKGKAKIVFEDSECIALLHPEPAAKGHVVVTPRDKYTILEQIPLEKTAHLFSIANKISTAIFETTDAQGSNLLVQNGEPAGQTENQVLIHIIPRFQEDGISFEWNARQLSEEEMSTVELTLKESTKEVGIFAKKKEKPIDITPKPEKHEPLGEEENYYIKQLRKVP